MSVTIPIDPNTTRKDYPLYSGLLSYFPNALAYVSYVSKKANDQHNPGEPLHWAREKSTDHADCLMRHLLKKGERDEDGLLETGKVAWRALALLEEELEALRGAVETPATATPDTLFDWDTAPSWAEWAARPWGKDAVLWFSHLPLQDAELGFRVREGQSQSMSLGREHRANKKYSLDSLEARPQRSTAA